MKTKCPDCQATIPVEDINVSKDIALCRKCNEIYSFEDLIEDVKTEQSNILTQPKGAWYTDTHNGFIVGATTRHFSAFLLVPFMCVWSGFSLGILYGSQIISGEFSWVLSLIGLPFLLGTFVIGGFTLMSVAGKQELIIDGDMGTLFTGVGPIGVKRSFSIRDFIRVKEGTIYSDGSPLKEIVLKIDKGKDISFGQQLNKERLDYIESVLRVRLKRRN